MSEFPAHLDPEIEAILGDLPRLDLTDIPAARAERSRLAARNRALTPPHPEVTRTDEVVGRADGPEIAVRRYRPKDLSSEVPLPCLLWIHGGGHVMGEVDQDDPFLEHVAATLGMTAVSVDWRRAPEHPFPAELDDAYTVLRWVHGSAARLGVDPARVAVGGASSGGGTAAGLALLARDRGERELVAYQMLIYPMLDDRTDSPAHAWLDSTELWHRQKNAIAWRAFLNGQVSQYAAPARAEDLRDLPPVFIATGDLDLFAEEDCLYAARLIAAGIPVELHVYPGGVHGFELFVPEGTLASQLRRDRDKALASALRIRNAPGQKLVRSPGQL